MASASEPVILDTVLRPNQPLPRAVLRRIVGAVAAFYFVFAFAFVLQGAWLVTPFMGLDVVLLAWAFGANVRAAGRFERVRLTPSALLVERHAATGGAPKQVTLNPYWVRVEAGEPPERGGPVMLWSHGRGLGVGAFLPPKQRCAFAKDLKAALRRAREPNAPGPQ